VRLQVQRDQAQSEANRLELEQADLAAELAALRAGGARAYTTDPSPDHHEESHEYAGSAQLASAPMPALRRLVGAFEPTEPPPPRATPPVPPPMAMSASTQPPPSSVLRGQNNSEQLSQRSRPRHSSAPPPDTNTPVRRKPDPTTRPLIDYSMPGDPLHSDRVAPVRVSTKPPRR
jgi:hypothetical protein